MRTHIALALAAASLVIGCGSSQPRSGWVVDVDGAGTVMVSPNDGPTVPCTSTGGHTSCRINDTNGNTSRSQDIGLTETPAPGWSFYGWSALTGGIGGCMGLGMNTAASSNFEGGDWTCAAKFVSPTDM